jgi:monoamine oxidase
VESLAEMLGLRADDVHARIASAHVFDWQADAFARGAYSYVRVGGDDAVKRLAEPVGGMLFFAGEAAHGGMSGTVAGALASGHDAAEAVLRTV